MTINYNTLRGVMPSGIQVCDLSDTGIPTTTVETSGGLPLATCQNFRAKSPITLPRLTQVELDTLENLTDAALVDGMLCANSTTGKIIGRTNGSFSTISSTFGLATKNLTRANILALGTAIELIPAPGANLAIIPLKVTLVNKFNTAAFATGGAVTIGWDSATVQSLSATIPATFVNSAAAAVYNLLGVTGASVASAGIVNKNLAIKSAANFTLGNAASVIAVNVWYATVSTA